MATGSAFGRTIEVGATKAVCSLRRGIALAHSGDTVLLHAGTYREGNIIISKPLTLIGIGGPVLDGQGRFEQLTISGERIRVRGLRFTGTGYSSMNDNAAISIIDARFVTIEGNCIERAYFAIHVANASYCTIANNRIAGIPRTEQTSGNGIHLWKCARMLVQHNDVQGHRDGIYFEFVTASEIRRNYSHDNIRYGLHFMFSNNDAYEANTFASNGAGVAVMYSNHVRMERNFFRRNWGANAYGLLLKEISDAQIRENVFEANTAGIMMESTNRVEVLANAFRSNGWALRISASCNENTVCLNNFQGNTFDVATNGDLMLNRFFNNYWDKYDGYDLNRDGKGDVPYHPVSLYSMVIERNPQSVMLLRSFMVTLLDKAEKAMPSLTPGQMVDAAPLMKPYRYDRH
ncbi:nitrous oxide reductase family maturation protein NosD [Flaviaesturariibacter flavus]|uniref:nitrous oxide reductase family maturation protein NosD n=1 Tax=Flaviaesturariibacter flavus TaxID=2502780 RepID=UPI001A9D5737|nr:nitrous oxide reductase family maturation protein NosD [Flaviaesturariibacter flavus]